MRTYSLILLGWFFSTNAFGVLISNIDELAYSSSKAMCAKKETRNTFLSGAANCGEKFSLESIATAVQGKAIRYRSTDDGDKILRNRLQLQIKNLNPQLTYQITAKFKYENRNCYIEETLESGLNWTGGRREAYKGFYCGRVKFSFSTDHGGIDLVNKAISDYQYVSNRETQWFTEKSPFFKTTNGLSYITLFIDFDGYIGDVLIDAIELKSIDQATPIELGLQSPTIPSFGNMNLVSSELLAQGLPALETNAFRVQFESINNQDSILFFRKSASGNRLIGKLSFPVGTLIDSKVSTQGSLNRPGAVSAWNSNYTLALYSDSSFVFMAKKPLKAILKGSSEFPGRSSDFLSSTDFGVSFQSDGKNEEGFFVSPIYPKQTLSNLPASTWSRDEHVTGKFMYNSAEFLTRLKEPVYKIISSGTSSSELEVEYNLSDFYSRLFVSLFPPKPFPTDGICDRRHSFLTEHTMNDEAWRQVTNVFAECKYKEGVPFASQTVCVRDLMRLKSPTLGLKYVFINSMKYAYSENTVPPLFKKIWKVAGEAKIYTSYMAPGEMQTPLGSLPNCKTIVPNLNVQECQELIENPFDVMGPWKVRPDQLQKFRDFLNALRLPSYPKANSSRLEAILYTSPQYYMTKDLSLYISEVKQLLTDTGAKGLYLDGLPDASPISNLQFMRQLRAALGQNKILILHLSSNNSTYPDSYHTLIPAIEAYVDIVAKGEGSVYDFGLKQLHDSLGSAPLPACPGNWGMMYSGRSSGTPSLIFPELKNIDLTKSIPENHQTINVPPARQIEAQIKCGGGIWAPPRESTSPDLPNLSQITFIHKFSDSNWWSKYPSSSTLPGYWEDLKNHCGD